MNMIVVLVILALVSAIVIVNVVGGEKPDKRKAFLDRFARIVESTFEPIEGYENAFRIRFDFEGKPFVYEDYEEKGLQITSYKGYLRLDTGKKFSLSFGEKKRSSIRADVQSIDEVTNPWARGSDMVRLPKSLSELRASTNRPDVANEFLADDAVVKQYEKYKNVDSRGYHSLSLEINSGVMSLSFHPKPDMKPSLFKLRRDVASLLEHLKAMQLLDTKLKEFKDI